MTVLPFGRSAIISGSMLGLGRALGETMAVTIILSVSGGITFNLISSGNPSTIAANIALDFPESSGLDVNALIASGLVLFAITLVVNMAARAVIGRQERVEWQRTGRAHPAPSSAAGRLPELGPYAVGAGQRWSSSCPAHDELHDRPVRARHRDRLACRDLRRVAAVESTRKAKDRLMTVSIASAFVLALLPLISLLYTVVSKGLARFDVEFFTESARDVVGEGGGAAHAIFGTLIITGVATVISVPIGVMAAIYLQEYGKGRLRQAP